MGMDSTTCYDLGKARDAYHGGFQHQTHINLPLLEKVLAVREGRGCVGRTPWSAAGPWPASRSEERDEGVPRGPGGPPHEAAR